MFINPKSTSVKQSVLAGFAYRQGLMPYSDLIRMQENGSSCPPDTLEKTMASYLSNILDGQLSKGTRPWELNNVLEDNDPTEPWIGIEWETGFATRNQYRAAIQWLWENHHNWAVDNEGIGPYRGELTFPPVNQSAFNSKDNAFDKLREWMSSKNINTPTEWEDIELPPAYRQSGSCPRAGWGMHVNISLPECRTNKTHTMLLNYWLTTMTTRSMQFSGPRNNRLFGRRPYGMSYHRSSSDGLHWTEWKLFHTPASDAEVENIRAVTNRLTSLMRHVAQNIGTYVSKGGASAYERMEVLMHVPSVDAVYNYLIGESDDLTPTSTHAFYIGSSLHEINNFLNGVNV